MAMTAETADMVLAGQGAGKEAESSLMPHENRKQMEQSEAQQAWVLQNFFRVQDPLPYLRDSACGGLVNFVMSMMQFQVHYQFIVDHIGGGIGQTKIEASGGENLSERLNGMTLRSVAEQLKKGMEQQCRDFCKSFKSWQSSLQTGATKAERLIRMQQRRPEDGPVPSEKLERALRLEDLRAAVECLTRPKAEMLEVARVFLDTANSHLFHSNMAQELMERIPKAQEERSRQEKERQRHEHTVADLNDRKALLEQRLSILRKVKAAGGQAAQADLKAALKQTNALLAAACDSWSRRKDQCDRKKRCTFLKLQLQRAERDIREQEGRKARIEEELGHLSAGRQDEAMKMVRDDEEKDEQGLEETTRLAQEAASRAQDLRRAVEQSETECQNLQEKLRGTLGDGKDYATVGHMMAAHSALASLAQSTQRDADVADVVSQDWARELESFIDVGEMLVSARSLDEQKDAVADLKDYIDGDQIPLMRLAVETAAMPSLQMPANLPSVLLDRPSAGARRNTPHVSLLPPPARAQALPEPELAATEAEE